MSDLGVVAQMTLEEPAFSGLLWKMSPAAFAKRLSDGQWQPWPYLQLLSRKLIDVAMGRCKRLIVTMPPRHGKPISTSELVLMGDGSRKFLGDVEVGEFVLTNKGRPRRVSAVHDQGNLDCVTITTMTGRTLTAALDHPVMTSGGWKTAKDVLTGDFLCFPKKLDIIPTSMRRNEEFRYTGYVVGDGCVTINHGSGNMYVDDDDQREDVAYCARVLGIDTAVEYKICTFTKAIPWLKSAELYAKTSHTKVVPSWVFSASNTQIAQFISGYFATDGSVSDVDVVRLTGPRAGQPTGCTIAFGSVSKKLLEGVRHLLMRLEVSSNLRVKRGRYLGKPHLSWILVITDRASINNFIDKIPVFHGSKKPKLDEWRKFLKGVRSRPTGRQPDDSYVYDRVVGIEDSQAECRCLTVDEDQTFTANDFIVHNSEVVSKWFPTWFLENFPDKRVILCSYEADFAVKWGGKVRDIIMDKQDLLNARFKSKTPAMHSWELEEGGGMTCAGAGGPITGKGADLLIIDDPIKNSEEAESLLQREKLWDWWLSTARTRLEPGGSVVLMMTRWHSDDLIGKMLNPDSYPEKGLKDEWEVYNFPALAEPDSDRHYLHFGVKVNDLRPTALANPLARLGEDALDGQWTDAIGRRKGEALCPDRYNDQDLAKIRGGSSEKVWYSLYQQRPGDEAAQGNVYHTFEERQNCRALGRNDSMQLFIALDFNVDPMCAVIGQYDPGAMGRMMERVEILEEIILANSNTYAMSETILKRLSDYKAGYTLSLEVYGDAAGTQRTANSKKTNWQIVAEHLSLDTAIHYRFIRKKDNPNITDRVNAINGMLRSADGTVRMYLNYEKCQELIKDFQRVKWQTDNAGNSTGVLDKKDKKRTHVSDALGYMIEYKYGMKTRAGGRKGVMM